MQGKLKRTMRCFVVTVVYFVLLSIENIHNFFLFSSTKFSGLIDASCSQGL